MPTVNEIDAILPQTQCGECGYAGCRPYAEALAAGLAPIDRCPPGGVSTLNALGALFNMDVKPYVAFVQQNTRAPALAMIRESECIGCTKCIQSCPVDAIIGAAKHMHTVLTDECTGCGLCVEPCPVDCIDMNLNSALLESIDTPSLTSIYTTPTLRGLSAKSLVSSDNARNAGSKNHGQPVRDQRFSYDPQIARMRFQAKQIRLLQQEHARQAEYQAKRCLAAANAEEKQDIEAKQAYILQALARVKEKKNHE